MRTRDVNRYAAEGQQHITQGREISVGEVNQLKEILNQGGPDAVYNCIMESIYFGFEIGLKQGQAEAKADQVRREI